MIPTRNQKELALKEFNLRDKSKYWVEFNSSINRKLLARNIGLSDYTVGDWYVQWKLNPDTKLDRPLSVPNDKVDEYRDKYYEKLANGITITDLEAVLEYGVPRGLIKKWKSEYKKNGGVIQPCKRHRTLKVEDGVLDKSPEIKTDNSVNNGKKVSDVDVLDIFFDGLIGLKERVKSAEKEVEFYKQKCQKWAAQVVELQGVIATKD
jgi:hypothetical protein